MVLAIFAPATSTPPPAAYEALGAPGEQTPAGNVVIVFDPARSEREMRAALLQAKWTGDTASMIEVHESYARSAAEQGDGGEGLHDVRGQAIEARIGRFWDSAGWATYRLGIGRSLSGVLGAQLHAALPDGLPAFAPDAEVRATLRGPSFPVPVDLRSRCPRLRWFHQTPAGASRQAAPATQPGCHPSPTSDPFRPS